MKREIEYRGVVIDTAILVFCIVVTALFFYLTEITQNIYAYIYQNRYLEVILIVAISFLYLLIFTLRRFFELKKMIKKANTDTLVNVYNRRKGLECIKEAMKQKTQCSLVMFDIDDFKKINDDFGHIVGDIILEEVVKLIKNLNRKSDLLIRWGGDEFVLLCYKTTKVEAYQLSNRLREKIQEHEFSNGISITASFGVIALEYEKDLKEQINQVDKNMYKSKETGKNSVYM